MRFPAVAIALLLATAAQAATTTAANAAPPAGMTAAGLDHDVSVLASDAFEGRKPGTPGGDKAVAYIIERMKAIGLTPGNQGQWIQPVPLVTITADPKLTLNVTGGADPLVFRQVDDVVLWSRQQVEKVSVTDSAVVFVGFGINAPERGWNDYAGIDVRGKTVVMLVNDPDWETKAAGPAAGPFEGRAMTYYGRYTYKYEEAARQGAAAAIIIHAEEPAAYPFEVVINSNTGPKIGLDLPNKSMDTVPVEGWITGPAATKMFASAGKDLVALTAAAKVRGFKAVPLGLKASTEFTQTIVRSASANVIGILPGTKRPNEIVLYTAHWDHLGRCPADATGDDICNGALDNASGVAGLLAMAQAYKDAPRTERSTMFMAVTAEESGLLGSRWYAENPVYPLRDTVGGVNMDGLNIIGPARDVVITGAGKSELEPMFAALAAKQGRVVKPESSPEKGGYFRSDHFSFAKFGVPMLDAGSGHDIIGKPAGWGEAQAAEFTAKHYHKPSDNYDPNWNWTGALQDLTLYYELGRELADSDIWPNWNQGAEFRAARDKSRAGQ